jgi:hypothetical protein
MNNQNFYLTDDNNKGSNNEDVRIPTYEELFKPILFNLDGTRSADEWLAYSLFDDLSELRAMTAGQLFRWIHRKDPTKTIEQIRDFVANLFRHKFIGKMTVEVPVVQSRRIRADENELKKVTIIYLNHVCQPFLSDGKKSFARFGQPSGTDLERIYHSLLITEAVLLLSGSCQIACLKSEDRIKSELKKSNQNGSQSVVDFHICLVIRRADDVAVKLKVIAGEVVVQSDSADISGKPTGTTFFTSNQRAADLIQTLRKEPVFLLDDVALPAFAETHLRDAYDEIFDPSQLLLRKKFVQLRAHKLDMTRDCFNIICILSMLGPLTESALAVRLNLKRANVSKKLKVLIAKNILHSEDVQLAPGSQIGRPQKLFAFIETDLSDYGFRVSQLKTSLSLTSS